ncbi:Disintegrin and metalloproteinase domain-containing protein 12-like protein [Dinothrombium tinctorium]|uniref:Disintegrin and metalloproteinase domain-containing protein 12-like protein n=1 Tax=Dinothrombium tinctorium TaxID=1965070 RepID=A0A3S3NZB3_9ACAR|nr:Disintegrin and metalloproteinase domain-containing protein 12-like protein [Dinothrombium tinctorium]RWS07942.1 Disintegrin and metalloproteinase domain-containing protein 12-like protein [Dinothrombium tinctorium]RWS08796.1 Disintegrin and metalloproteinase domain-containing protein 12-like protein [Dinothrombium tinctorium]RWS08801.1 Disintegrin and metalloproteinase domain-containing protein 12-like protein [Dinothrombium tinctorium]
MIALSLCRNEISGLFVHQSVAYHLHFDPEERKNLIFRDSDFIEHFLRCDVRRKHRITKRSKRLSFKRFSNIHSSTLFLELILVNDYATFVNNGRSIEKVREENQKIANIVNVHFRELDLMVVLVDVVVWNKGDPISITTNTSTMLDDFLDYRRNSLNPRIKHDNAQLIIGKFSAKNNDIENRTKHTSGIAMLNVICNYDFSGGIVYDRSRIISFVAASITHEIGHNLGMEHDNASCRCAQSDCIMTSLHDMPYFVEWSNCSKNHMKSAFKNMNFECLRDTPLNVVGPSCGNGVLEQGEECDCDQTACLRCCDNKCKLKRGAECGTGVCCDFSKCKIINSNKICRWSGSECDLAEYCNGKSEFCPENERKPNGWNCSSGFCFDGSCVSGDEHCKTLWGANATIADDICFKFNQQGNVKGNCGFDHQNRSIACDQSNYRCGMFFCHTSSKKLTFSGKYSKYISLHRQFSSQGKMLECTGVIYVDKSNRYHPLLAPNGAWCATNEMCIDQRCVNTNEVINAFTRTLSSYLDDDYITDKSFTFETDTESTEKGFFAASIYTALTILFILMILVAFALYLNRKNSLIERKAKNIEKIEMREIEEKKSINTQNKILKRDHFQNSKRFQAKSIFDRKTV